jgi:hypothetical protein
MNAAHMGQCIDPTMMTARLCLALNVIYKCQGSTVHLGLYSKVAAGVEKSDCRRSDVQLHKKAILT